MPTVSKVRLDSLIAVSNSSFPLCFPLLSYVDSKDLKVLVMNLSTMVGIFLREILR